MHSARSIQHTGIWLKELSALILQGSILYELPQLFLQLQVNPSLKLEEGVLLTEQETI